MFRKPPARTLVEFENYWGNPLGSVPWDGPLPRVGEHVLIDGRCEMFSVEVVRVEHAAHVKHFAMEGTRRRKVRITVIFPNHAERMEEAAT